MLDVGPVVHIVDSRTITSQGDALRELESLGVELSDPFVLMSGDTVANVNLRHVVEEHRARRERDSKVVMTSLLMTSPHDATSRAHADNLCVAYDATTMQLLAYVRFSREPLSQRVCECVRHCPSCVWGLFISCSLLSHTIVDARGAGGRSTERRYYAIKGRRGQARAGGHPVRPVGQLHRHLLARGD